MKDKLFIIGKVIGLLVFILALSLMGMASGKPIMILAYAGFFVIVMFIIFQFVKRNQRHFEIISQTNPKVMKIVGVLMLLIAIAIPASVISTMQIVDLGSATVSIVMLLAILAITITLIICGILGVYLINRKNSGMLYRILGYAIIVIASAIPALMVIPHDHTTTGIGSVYYVALLVAILSWWGITLYLNKD
jgi:hypothetical protein